MSEPFRRTPTGIAVDLPHDLRAWLAERAEAASSEAVDLGGSTHRRLMGPIDLTADHDDPLLELQRQMAVEGPLAMLSMTASSTEISEDEAEQWIRGLQLVLAAEAARRSLRTEDDVAGLDEREASTITTLQALISLMIDALDG